MRTNVFFPPFLRHAILVSFAFLTCSSVLFSQSDEKSLKELAEIVLAHQQKTKVPAIFAAVILDQGEPSIVAVGQKKQGESDEVSTENKVHLGSCTKAITALLAARLVDKKKISWDSKLREVMPELMKQIHTDYGDVTLQHLLSHRSGMVADAKNWRLMSSEKGNTLDEIRHQIAIANLSKPPTSPPGKKFQYSNFGYMMAGLMIAKANQKSWEESLKEEILEPLKIDSAGFGIPDRDSNLDQPWGHIFSNGKANPIQIDNPPALGPAGTLHMSLDDWAKILQVFASSNKNEFVSKESYKSLSTSFGDDYAMGWIVVPQAKGQALSHDGSNTTWYASVWIFPADKRAYVVVTNSTKEDIADSGSEAQQLISKLKKWDRARRTD